MDDGPLGSGPLNHGPLGLLGGLGSPASGDSDSSDGSSSGSTSSPPSPPTLSSPESSSTPSAPPPESSSGASPSPPSPPLSPPPAPPAGGGSPLLQVSAPGGSNAIPSPEAPKHGGGGGGSSSEGGSSKGGSGGRGKSGSGSRDGSAPPVAAVVVGVVIGVLAFGLLLAIAACVCCARRKKKPRHPPHMNMPYYTDQNGNVYYANSMPKWQNSGAVDVQGRGMGWQPQYSPGQGPPLSEEMTSGTQSHGTGGTPPPPSPAMALGFGAQSSFTYDELAAGTGGFAQANLLGQGGFGFVYKGVLPGSGKEVAVKQLKAGSGQGEREFQAEVEIISRVHHRHLVSLVGYCIAGSSQRLLVYEFVPNDTLERHLHGKGVPVMNWTRRLAIALGSAKGLAYLHEDCHPRIIHRDIKAANILLDENFDAKVADFGLAKLTTDNNTHVSTRVMGTFGYLAPEYASSGKLTDKSDVFSFGVMMLELITGRRPVDTTNHMEDSLVDWARPLLAQALSEGGSFDELIDPRLENRYDRSEMERMAAAAAAAVRHSAKRRPKMKQIVRALEGDASLDDLHDGVKPGQSMMFSSGSEGGSGGNYASDINRLRQIAFESSEEYSNEYSESGDTARRHH